MANQMNTRPEASRKQISCCFSFPSPLLSFHEAPRDSEGEWDTPLVSDMRREENGSHAGFKTFPETSGLSQEGGCPLSLLSGVGLGPVALLLSHVWSGVGAL